MLEQLFPSLGADRFLDDYFPDRLYVEHGPLERLGELGTRAVFDDATSIIGAAREGEQIYYYTRDSRGAPEQRACTHDAAARAYENGHSVEFDFSACDPVTAEWCDALCRELRISAPQTFAEIVLSPGGKALPKHFDSVEVLIVQLRGEKRWLVAPNEQVAYPPIGYIPGFGSDLRDTMMARADIPDYSKLGFTTEMPADSRVIDMRPGSVLFLPRGWWHQTEVDAPSTSLSVVLSMKTMAELLGDVVKRTTRRLDHWRRPAHLARRKDVRSTQVSLAKMLRELDAQLEQALDSVVGFSKPKTDERSFVVSEGVTIEVASSDGPASAVRFTAPNREDIEMMLPENLAVFLQWMFDARQFTHAEADGRMPSGTIPLDNLLSLLIERGALELS